MHIFFRKERSWFNSLSFDIRSEKIEKKLCSRQEEENNTSGNKWRMEKQYRKSTKSKVGSLIL